MSTKSRIAVMTLTAALVALSICAVPGAMAKSSSSSQALRFKVVKRTSHYDVVKGRSHRFAVKRGAHKVTVHGVWHYRLVRRTPHFVFLRALTSHAASKPSITSPNSGAFVKGSPTTITWGMSSAVSSGYFRVSMKSTLDGASTGLTAANIPVNRKTTSYSVPWDVAQPVGTYKVWVYYYSAYGGALGSDASDGIVSITVAPAPTPTSTPTGDPVAAINAARAGQTITVPAGTFSGEVTIPSGVTVQGAGMDASWIKGTVVYGSNDVVRDLKIGDVGKSTRNGPNASNTLFERVRFRGGGESGVSWPNNSVLIIGSQYSADHITFRSCIVERNLGSDPDFSKGFNNISLTERSNVHVEAITIEDSTVGASNGSQSGSPRMGMEAVVQDTASTGFRDITLRGSTFLAADSETLDFSDQPNARANGVLIEGSTIQGGGVTNVKWGYGICLEMPLNVVIRNNVFTRAWMQSLAITNRNLSGFTGPAAQITGNTFDLTTGIASSGGEPLSLKGANNSFTGNTLKGGWGGDVLGLWNASGNTVTGNTFSQRDGAAAILEHTDNSGNVLSPNTVQ